MMKKKILSEIVGGNEMNNVVMRRNPVTDFRVLLNLLVGREFNVISY